MTTDSSDIIYRIMSSRNKVYLPFPGKGTISDIVRFGFSYIEYEDNYVCYLLTHPLLMKVILCGINDSVLDPDKSGLGNLWTSKLLTTKRLKTNQIIFANEDLGVILSLDIPNPHKIEEI